MENEKHRHPCHKQEIPRLNRVIGQLEGVKKMIEELRYCPDILIQLRAARSAIRAVESNILKTHLQSCVAQSFASEEDKEQKLNELKELFDRFKSKTKPLRTEGFFNYCILLASKFFTLASVAKSAVLAMV